MSFRDVALDNQKRHKAFRRHYWFDQTRYVSYMALGGILLGVLGIVVFVPTLYRDFASSGRLKYCIAIAANFITYIWATILLKNDKMPEEKKAASAEYMNLFLGISYLSWGILAMDISWHQHGVVDEFPYFLTLAILTAFFFYPGHHYFVIIMVSVIAFMSVLVYHAIIITPAMAIETVLALIVLFRLGDIHYTFARNNFESDQQNKNLLEETEASNEELIAINSELTETTVKLEDALKKVQASADYQKAFSASLSHDMRAPLNGIIGTIQVMLMNDNLSDEQKEDMETCMSSSKTLLNLVNDVLDYSKIEAEQLEIIPVDFDLHDVVNAVYGMFKVQAEKKGLDFKLQIPDNTPCDLFADDFRIQQVMTNIVSNAIKYTEVGKVDFRVSVADDKLTFVVEDSGQGMSPEGLKDLFVPFKRINEKKNKRIQGTGLGMAIVHYSVEKMNGTIDVESVEGMGSTFTVTIPVTVRDTKNTWQNQVREKTIDKTLSVDFTGRRILYIDDTAVNLKIVSKMLSGTGAKVEITPKPVEGLKMLATREYDMLMVDHLMPDIDGEEIISRLRASESPNKDIPVIVLTGNSGAGAEEHYKKLGFAGYLTKPIMRTDLIEVITACIK